LAIHELTRSPISRTLAVVPGQPLTPEDYVRARRVLMRRDPVLATAIRAIGPCLMADRQRKDHLTALAGSIVSQQLSTKAAATIFGRFVALFPEGHPLDPAAILAVDDLGIVNAVQRLYKLRKRPDAKKLHRLGEAWKPYRSVASWYLWQSLKITI
jgi:3-methyladenine DNA glycosylase/8-oxoguanine DNA glycosylase